MKDWQRRLLTSFVIGLLIFFVFWGLLSRRDDLVNRSFKGEQGHFPVIESAEQIIFDYLFNFYKKKGKYNKVVYLAIDDATQYSLSANPLFGRWPWNRGAWEGILDFVSRGKPKAILFDIIFAEPNLDDSEGITNWPQQNGTPHGLGDMYFRDAIADSGFVYLPYRMSGEKGVAATTKEVDFLKSVVPTISATSVAKFDVPIIERARELSDEPIPAFRDGLMGLGWVDGEQDADSALRRTALFMKHTTLPDRLFPSLGLAAVLKGEPGLITVDKKGNLLHRGKVLPRDNHGHYLIAWSGLLEHRYPDVSLGNVVYSQLVADEEMSKKEFVEKGGDPEKLIDPSIFKDKYVLIGTTILAAHDRKETPFGPSEPGVVKHLTIIEGLLEGRFMERAPTSLVLLIVLALCLGGAVLFLMAGSPFRATIMAVILALTYGTTSAQLFGAYRYQLDVFTPLVALATTYLVCVTWNYFVEDRKRREVRGMFSKYMSPEIVAMLEADPDLINAVGDRRELTAFFSDLANFTTLSETLEPEELLVLINEYLELMTAEIIEQGGYLDKYQGDGIMAVFGVYPGESNHALDACRAALGNQRDIIGLQQRWEEEGKPKVAVRIGINSGPMVAGNVGYEGKLNYTVLGDAVNLAARLEGANKQFGTLVMLGEMTYALVKDDVLVRELDVLAVKGKKQGVHVYELLGIKGEDVLTEQQYALLDAFDDGLMQYRSQKFDEAIKHFKVGLEIMPKDGPCQAYIDRCKIFKEDPPGKDWDGVFRLKTK